jgi:pimeloyl-ACP methyl ester carboxylesterase
MTCEWWVNHQGQRLFAVVNTPLGEAMGTALFLPPFGLHLHNLFQPAFYLAHAGFRTIRFDGRNNVGASDGDIIDYRMGIQIEDARYAAARLVETFGRDDFLIFGLSVSAAVALVLATEYPRARLFLLAPIIDIGRTVNLVSRDPDCLDSYRRRSPDAPRFRRVFSQTLHAQEFCDDFLEAGIGSAEEIFALAHLVRGRTDLVLAGNDEYCTPELRRRLIEALDAAYNVLVLEQSPHNVGKSPEAFRRAFSRLVEAARDHFAVPEDRRGEPVPPDSAMATTARIEQQTIHAFFNGHRIAS